MSNKFYRTCLCMILAVLLTAGCAAPPAQQIPTEPVPTATESPVTESTATEPVIATTAPAPSTEPTAPAETEPEVTYTEVKETVYATRYVNVRVAPDASSQKYTYLEKGEAVTRIGVGSDGWSQIVIAGDIYYVNSLYLTRKTPAKDDVPEEDLTAVGKVYATKNVDIRSGPGTNYKTVGTLKKGKSLFYISMGDNGWTKVIYKDAVRFIPSSALTTVKPGTSESTVPAETEPVETTPVHVHDYVETEVVAPTCTKGGYTVYTCSCNDSYQGNETPAAGHSWGDWVITEEATTETAGEQERTCGTCSTTETETIPMLEGETPDPAAQG